MGLSGAADTKQVGRVIGTVIDNLVIVALLAVGLTVLLRQDIALILLGPEFRDGSIVMPAVLAGVFCGNIGTFAHKPFEIAGRTRLMVTAGFTAAAANIAFCFALIPAVGLVGAAYATLLAYLLYAVLVGALGRRIIPWRLNGKRILVQGAIIVFGVSAIAMMRSLVDTSYAVELALTGAGCAFLASVVLLGVTRRSGGPVSSGVNE
jgi:O-antigen/teichoic acid export membrane protein